MNKGKRVIGVILIFVSIVLLISWEKWGKTKFLYEEIPVFNQDVQKGSVVTEKMLIFESWPKNNSDFLRHEDASKVIGMTANQLIKKNNPLYIDYFIADKYKSSSGDDKYVMEISNNWIDSCPNDIVKSNRIFIYSEGRYITKVLALGEPDDEGNLKVISSNKQIKAISSIVSSGRKLVITYDEGS